MRFLCAIVVYVRYHWHMIKSKYFFSIIMCCRLNIEISTLLNDAEGDIDGMNLKYFLSFD